MVMKYKFRGMMVPVFTPFTNSFEQSICMDSITGYAKYLKEKNITGILVNGTTGEGVSMSMNERKMMVEAWMKASKSTNQVIMAQIGGASMTDVKEMAKHAEEMKVSAILCLPDLFFKPKTIQELTCYLTEVSKMAPHTPLFYYHYPAMTDVNLNMFEFLTYAMQYIPTLSGMKFTCKDLDAAMKCLKVNSDITIFLGADTLFASGMLMGFDSAIMTTLNLWPEEYIKIKECMEKGQMLEARRMQMKINDKIHDILSGGSWVAQMKHEMSSKYINMGLTRPPLNYQHN